jgi:formylglycine-generating enzyme required for sulfatase activity
MSRAAQRSLLLLAVLGLAPLLLPTGPSSSAPAPLAPPRNVVNSIGMKLVRIPKGKFKMGAPRDDIGAQPSSRPQHEVEITRPFYLGVYEVTQAQYKKVMGTNPSAFAAGGRNQHLVARMNTDDFPVDNVSLSDAIRFCAKLSALPAEKGARRKYRLPTEAEWEYACRAGTTTAFHCGATLSTKEANIAGPLRRTCKVGSYKPNAFGLYDMHGNVWEWCADWYADDYYAKSPKKDPYCKTPVRYRMSRGGSWYTHDSLCRSAYRGFGAPVGTHQDGFRAACTIGGAH